MAGISNDLFPPIIDSYMPGFLPANGCRVYFSISNYNNFDDISKAEITLKYQIDNSSALIDNAETMEKSINIDSSKISNDKYYFEIQNEDLSNNSGFTVGTIYKLQIRLYDNENNRSEWSTVCLLKPIAEPIVNVELFNNKNNNTGDVAISANIIEFYGNLSWENNEQAEVLYYYQLDLHKKSTDELIESSGMIYTDTNVQVFNYIFKHELEDNETYYIKLTYCFTSMYQASEIYEFVYFPFENTIDTSIELQASDENGYVAVYIDTEKLVPGNYALLRTSSDNDFKVWDTYYYFTKEVNAEDIEVVIEELNLDVNKSLMAAATPESVKSGQYHIYHDHTIQSGVLYKYKIQRLGLNNIRIADSEVSAPIMCYFDHMFLSDKDFKLKIKFDPTLDSFKKNITESKTDTLGGKYPIIRRNGASDYQTFSVSGLIAIEDEDFENWKKQGKEWENYYYDKYGVRRTNDFVSEKAFRDKVSSFLHNGKVKLFRSVQEGNFLVRLMNVSLTSKKELGRMLYSFSAEATEIAECKYDNYIKYHIIEDTELPEGQVAAFTLPVIGQIANIFVSKRIEQKYNRIYNYKDYILKGFVDLNSIIYTISNLGTQDIHIYYVLSNSTNPIGVILPPTQNITLTNCKSCMIDDIDNVMVNYEGQVEYTYIYGDDYSFTVQYISNNVGQEEIIAGSDILTILQTKYYNDNLHQQIEKITQLTFNNLSDEDVIVEIKYNNSINNITIAANNKYTLFSEGAKDIVSIVPQKNIYIDYNYVLSQKVIESEE